MATFYADSAGTQGTGDGSSAANAATLKQCITNDAVLHTALVAGSVIYCKSGTTITFDGANFANTAVAGTTTSPIRLISYTTTITDGGVTTIQNTTARTQNGIALSHNYWHISNFKFDQCKRGIVGTTSPGRDGQIIKNIEALNCANLSEISLGTVEPPVHINCYSTGATSVAFKSLSRNTRFINCVAVDGSAQGFQVGSGYGAILIGCLAHNNTGDGFDADETVLLVNCLSDGNSSDGYFFGVAKHPTTMINCGATNNGAYGVEGVANTKVYAINCGLNPTNETNTSGKSNGTNVTLYEYGEVTGDPLFTDKANDDFSLGSSSAWKAAGLRLGADVFTATTTYHDLGPAQRQEPAGGGGLIIHPGMDGGLVG